MIRRLHAWLAILASPTILFFAVTGALQLFNLHEPHDGYRPPLIVAELARVHKDQVFAPPTRHYSPAPTTPGSAAAVDPADPLPVVLLRWVFLAATLVLCASTALGLWLALRNVRRRGVRLALLAFGAGLPIALVCI